MISKRLRMGISNGLQLWNLICQMLLHRVSILIVALIEFFGYIHLGESINNSFDLEKSSTYFHSNQICHQINHFWNWNTHKLLITFFVALDLVKGYHCCIFMI